MWVVSVLRLRYARLLVAVVVVALLFGGFSQQLLPATQPAAVAARPRVLATTAADSAPVVATLLTAAATTGASTDTPGASAPSMEHLVVATASSSNHFCWAAQLIHAVRLYEPETKIVFYDLGLTPEEAAWIQMVEGVDYRLFPFERYPPHFNVTIAAGQYAWKPAIIATCLEEAEYVVWMDSGDLLLKPLQPLVQYLSENGFYGGYSSGDLFGLTHPGTIKYLNVSKSALSSKNCNAAFLGFSRKHTRDTLAKDWLDCALIEDCIAPPGSSRKNHRQDQAVLSSLITLPGYSDKYKCETEGRIDVLFRHHVEYRGIQCLNPPASFAVGVPTSFDHVQEFYNKLFQRETTLLPSAKLLSIQIALVYATRLKFTYEYGPRIAVIANDATPALQQLSYGFRKNSMIVGVSGKPPGPELRLVQRPQAADDLTGGADNGTSSTGTTTKDSLLGPKADGVQMHFIEWKAAAAAAAAAAIGEPPHTTTMVTDVKICKEIVAKVSTTPGDDGRINGLIMIDSAESPMNLLAAVRTFKTVAECGTALMNTKTPWFAIWEAHGPMPSPNGTDTADSITITGTHQIIINVGPDHHILVASSFATPKSLLSLGSSSSLSIQ